MPALQVKDCPQDVYDQIKAYAAQDNRSIAQQTLTILQQYLDARKSAAQVANDHPAELRRDLPRYSPALDETDYLAKRTKTFERIRQLPPLPVSDNAPDAAALLAAIRDEEAR